MPDTAVAVLTEAQRATLTLLCDTFAPSIASASADEVERAFLERPAGALGIVDQIEGLMGQVMTPQEIGQFGDLLGALADEGFDGADVQTRTAIVHAFGEDPAAKLGLAALRGLTLLFFYGLPDEQGRNANWEAIGFPGPPSAPPPTPKTLTVQEVSGPSQTLTADVVVVGSGAGGGVIAARCAAAGNDVLVLEAGQYRNEEDFTNLEVPGYFDLYYGGGLASSESGSLALLAGATLGGGTVVNYMNCVRPPARILAEWAAHGLVGVDDESFVADHVEVVLQRLGANTEATTQNGTHRRMLEACDALGYEHRPIVRNASLDDDPEQCGFCLLGCQRGCKRSAMTTWLQDASDGGSRAVPGCHADRVLVGDDGRATGVAATVTHADGSTTALTVEATTVVVAAGSIESPALLLRSGLGGPAVGKHLRVHPAFVVYGVYDDPVEGWRGQVQSALSDHFFDIEDGCGFLLEAVGQMPAFAAVAFPWDDGAQHKQLMRLFPNMAPFITVARDHGSGEVVLDDLGRAVVRWDLDDEVDLRLAVRAHQELVRLHVAAGAAEIFTAHDREMRWRQGEDVDAYLRDVAAAPYDAGGVTCFSAHQMGSCRMGSDPATSVADGHGQLHGTPGVWIGDASAFPTAPGVNPMVTIMSLAHRTAGAILGD